MHPNEKVLRDSDEAQRSGDVEAFLAAYTDDIVVHIGGSSSLAGDYAGKDEFNELFARFQQVVPEYSFETHDYVVNDEHGVSLQRSHYRRGDETVDSDETIVCHFRDGKISEYWFQSNDWEALDSFIGG